MKHYDQLGYDNWVSQIRTTSYSNGFGYIWERQEVINARHFLNEFQQRLKDQYLHTWFGSKSLSSELCLYSDFKTLYTHELYLSAVTVRKHRYALASFRTSSHKLEVERDRHRGMPCNERKCALCQMSNVEDEYHYLIVWPFYGDLRLNYIPK